MNSKFQDQRYINFTKKIDSLKDYELTRSEFLEASREAIELKDAIPSLRADIAYEMVCLDSRLKKNLGADIDEIRGYFADLELPDAHVDTRELSVEQQWERLRKALNTSK
jgi:hypothetical protein